MIDPTRWRSISRGHTRRHRNAILEFLGGACVRCGLHDIRGLVIVQQPGASRSVNELYTLMLHEPDEAMSTLRVLCATCRQIERAHHSAAASPDPHPSPSPLDQPSDASPSDHSSSGRRTKGRGRATAELELADSDGVPWGSDF